MTTTHAFPEGPNGYPRASRRLRQASIALISTAVSLALAAGGLLQPVSRGASIAVTLAAVVVAFAGLAALALAARLAPQPTRLQIIAELQALLAELLEQNPADGRAAEVRLILTGLTANPHQPELIAQAHRRLELEGRRALAAGEVAAPLAIR